jgi:integrase
MKNTENDKLLTREQCAKLLSVAHGEMKGLILIVLTTGQRIGDILTLKRVDIDRALRFSLRASAGKFQSPTPSRHTKYIT